MRTSDTINDMTTDELIKFANAAWPLKKKPPPAITRLLSKLVFNANDCWLWRGSRHNLGYGCLPVPEMGESKAHRVSYRLFNGDIPKGMHVLHKCDERACVNPEHLFLGTHTDNMRDMAAKGRGVYPMMPGGTNPMAKLTPQIVTAMRQHRIDGMLFKDIADKYGVSTMTALRAIKRETWK